MNTNEHLYGFTVTYKKEIPSPEGALYIMEHKSGARLVYFEREDRNKTFAISFRTLPTDDTGVFHIIEHSTLCGSKKFPVKEPFVELLKSSLNTFLNAFTYEDKTVYPVSSQNDKDFLNLIEIYLDAVFYPLMIENENVFLQEGWHYSFDKSGKASYNGVVFNEMTGAYSSPEELSSLELSRALFRGTPFASDSGGNPKSIPTLTYDDFKTAHKKHYHPSNASVIIDGSVDLEATLPLIDSYLSAFERRKIELPEYVIPTEGHEIRKVGYKCDTVGERGRARISLGSVFADYKNQLDNLAATLLISVICGSNESPVKKALLDKRLCEDIYMYVNRSEMQTFVVEMIGVKENEIDKAIDELKRSITELTKNGISREELSATLSYLEFKLLEGESAGIPRGVSHAVALIDAMTYGVAPENVFNDEDRLAELASLIDTGYFEELLERILLKPTHSATVILTPSTSGTEIASPDLSLLSENEISALREKEEALLLAQSTPDTEQALSTIPTLSVSDLDKTVEYTPTKISEHLGRELILPTVKSGQILYVNAFFDASDLTDEELTLLSLLSSAITNLPTERYTPLELSSKIKAKLGSFATLGTTTSPINAEPMPHLKLVASLLTKNSDELIEITREALLHTLYDDAAMIEKLLLQIRSTTEDAMKENGYAVALGRAEAQVSSYGAVSEALLGYDAYKNICKYIKLFESEPEVISERLAELARRLFVRERITVSVASDKEHGEFAEDLAKRIVEIFPESKKKIIPVKHPPKGEKHDAVILPIDTAYAALVTVSDEAKKHTGALRVAKNVLSYGFLWESIRVKGGAYGTGFLPRRTGTLSFYSYRDPSPERSLTVYVDAPDALIAAAKSENLDKYIIGAIGDLDQPKSPKVAAQQATMDYLNGWNEELSKSERAEILSANKDSLLLAAKILGEAIFDSAACVVCGKEGAKKFVESCKSVHTVD